MTTRDAPVQFDSTCHLDVPVAVAFAFVSDHAGLPKWIPGLSRVDVDDSRASVPGGEGTRRTIHPRLGGHGVEVVTEFEPGARMVYSATDESMRGLCTEHMAELTCVASGTGTELRWLVRARPGTAFWKRTLTPVIFRLICGTAMRNLRRRLRG